MLISHRLAVDPEKKCIKRSTDVSEKCIAVMTRMNPMEEANDLRSDKNVMEISLKDGNNDENKNQQNVDINLSSSA